MSLEQLNAIATKMVAPGQGLLAADESTGTIGKRLASIGTENTEDNRRAWREMLFRTDKAMADHVSGVIMYDETLRQSAKDGTRFVDLIRANDAIPGIKVDMGAKPMAKRSGETITEGLDGLRDRLAEYYDLGARFAKWRAVIEISHPERAEGVTPSFSAIKANSHALARYAALCQEANIVPIVEPEVLMGGFHGIQRCHEVTEQVLKTVFADLYEQGVELEGIVLKPNMIIPGEKCSVQSSTDEIAERTVQVLKDCVPSAVPGIAFLSGGQDNVAATANLDAMNKIGGLPWNLTYSYGRALQQPALHAWKGQSDNYELGQAAFYKRAHMNGLASKGEWSANLENA
ncbi:MAG: class I fructose-bisphosphate aldolase [Maricaulaceae bacterium]